MTMRHGHHTLRGEYTRPQLRSAKVFPLSSAFIVGRPPRRRPHSRLNSSRANTLGSVQSDSIEVSRPREREELAFLTGFAST
jgi:hypothetical protein